MLPGHQWYICEARWCFAFRFCLYETHITLEISAVLVYELNINQLQFLYLTSLPHHHTLLQCHLPYQMFSNTLCFWSMIIHSWISCSICIEWQLYQWSLDVTYNKYKIANCIKYKMSLLTQRIGVWWVLVFLAGTVL